MYTCLCVAKYVLTYTVEPDVCMYVSVVLVCVFHFSFSLVLCSMRNKFAFSFSLVIAQVRNYGYT